MKREKSVSEQRIVEHFSERVLQYDNITTWVNNVDILKKMVELLPEEKKKYLILDLGAGTGVVSKYILHNYKCPVEITAVDCCSLMLEEIREPQIQTIEANIEKMPFSDNLFDIVISRQCLHYVDNLDLAMSEVRRILKNSGIFILAQIVPYDIATATYWKEVISIRQPLRKWFFTSGEWNELIKKFEFEILNNSKYSHVGSINKWVKKYNITELKQIDSYKKKLLYADENYKHTYSIQICDDDISYIAYWHIVKCIIYK